MADTGRLHEAYKAFDAANEKDPNKELYMGMQYPKEVLYAIRMTEKLNEFAPQASQALKLTARAQHICRWEIPRNSYEMNRAGYLKWRRDLKKFHAKRAAEILKEVGYDQDIIENVQFLLEKKQLKRNEDTQTLEDVICLVFLEFYFEPFAKEHQEEKVVDILQKTWRKMSKEGHEAALKLPLSQKSRRLVEKALS